MSDHDWNDAEKLKADLYAVLCERNEQAAEIERLQAHAKSMIDALNADIDAKHAEIELLRQEVADLLDELSLPCPTCGDTREERPGAEAMSITSEDQK